MAVGENYPVRRRNSVERNHDKSKSKSSTSRSGVRSGERGRNSGRNGNAEQHRMDIATGTGTGTGGSEMDGCSSSDDNAEKK